MGAVPVPGDFVKDLFPSQGRLTRASKVIEEYRDIPNKVREKTFMTDLTLHNLSKFLRFYRLRQNRGFLALKYFYQFLDIKLEFDTDPKGHMPEHGDLSGEIMMMDGSVADHELCKQAVSGFALADLLESNNSSFYRKHEDHDVLPITLINEERVMSISFFLLSPVCSRCGKLTQLPVGCPSCPLVRYCSQRCFDKGVKGHKDECENHQHNYCKNCENGSVSVKLRLCSECKAVRYCSKDCQKEHWSQHKHQCAELKAKHGE